MAEIVYIAHATATGGRHGHVGTDNNVLNLALSVPGTSEEKTSATNPEQLFACAYAACFGSSLEFVAQQRQIKLTNAEVQADVSLEKDGLGFFIAVSFVISLPQIGGSLARRLVEAAHEICPYSRATQSNIRVLFRVNDIQLPVAA